MGNAENLLIAIPLTVPGAAWAIGLTSGILGLRRLESAVATEAASAFGALISFALGIVAIVFILSFRW